VQVFAYELRMAAVQESSVEGGAKPRELASFDDIERFYEHLEQAMVEVGFLNPEHPKKLMPRLRRLFARAQLETEEVNILRGILKSFHRR
jgi:tRNA/rRNA methyltransferase